MSSINIATFNIWKNYGDFPKRIYELSEVFNSRKFDIICFQEDFNSDKFSSSKFLNMELDYNYITTTTRKKLRKDILSSSNLTVLSKYNTLLLDEVYFKKDTKDERAFQVIEVSMKKCKVLLINTRLCKKSNKDRIKQIKKILSYIRKYKNYDITMFCGDLNAHPNSEEIELIKNEGFKDKNIQHSHKNGIIIDYILYKTNVNISQVKSKVFFKHYSEHYCLANSFVFN